MLEIILTRQEKLKTKIHEHVVFLMEYYNTEPDFAYKMEFKAGRTSDEKVKKKKFLAKRFLEEVNFQP